MGLSVKVAMLMCLGFTFGMCWLVSEVARPMVALPTPLIVRGPDVGPGPVVAENERREWDRRVSAPLTVAGRFARPSPLEREAPAGRAGQDVVLVAAAPPMPDEPAEPPLHLPEAPVVVLADPVEPVEGAPVVESAVVTAPAPIPEAVIGEASAPRSRMLAAVLPEAPPSDEAVRSKDEPDAAPAAQTRKYRVRRGDTLVKIMRRQWKTDDPKALNLLLAANPRVAKRRDRIYAGEVLNIPLLEASQLTKVAGRRDRARAAGGRAPVRLYTIRKRDSLVSIARRFLHDAGRWREIAELNRMRDADLILPGTRIKLPGTVTQDT